VAGHRQEREGDAGREPVAARWSAYQCWKLSRKNSIAIVVGLLILHADTVLIKGSFIGSLAQSWDRAVVPPRLTSVPLLALALAAGLVLLGAGWLFSVIQARRSVPIPEAKKHSFGETRDLPPGAAGVSREGDPARDHSGVEGDH